MIVDDVKTMSLPGSTGTVRYCLFDLHSRPLGYAIFGEPDLDEKIEFGKSAVIGRYSRISTNVLSQYFFKIQLSH